MPGDQENESIAIKEYRNQLNLSEQRRRSVEAKIAAVLTVDTLIITVGGSLETPGVVVRMFQILALTSIGFGLFALASRKYSVPVERPDNLLVYKREMSPDEFLETLNLSYYVSLRQNRRVNNLRYRLYNVATILTSISLLAFFINTVYDTESAFQSINQLGNSLPILLLYGYLLSLTYVFYITPGFRSPPTE